MDNTPSQKRQYIRSLCWAMFLGACIGLAARVLWLIVSAM